MKLITYEIGGKRELGVLSDCEREIIPLRELGYAFADMNELIEKTTDEILKQMSVKAKQGSSKAIQLDSIKKCSPIPNPKQGVICLGYNYLSYYEDCAKVKGEIFSGARKYPIYVAKRVYESTPDDGKIYFNPEDEENLLYGVELAVIIKSNIKNVSEKEAMKHVFGYTIINDISSLKHEIQHTHPFIGKSFDGHLPMGPWITTADEFDQDEAFSLNLKLNGVLRQKSTTDHLIYSIPYIISELSKCMTLEAGTIIATGSPGDSDLGFEGGAQIMPGDVFECNIQGIGTLRNYIVQ